MKKNIIHLDDMRPHVTIPGLNRTHVIPIALLHKMASGEFKSEEIEDLDDFLPVIISEWLSNLGG